MELEIDCLGALGAHTVGKVDGGDARWGEDEGDDQMSA